MVSRTVRFQSVYERWVVNESASRHDGSVEAETTVAAIPVVKATMTRSTTSRADARPLIGEARRARETGLGIGIERILAPLSANLVSPEGTVRDSAVWSSEGVALDALNAVVGYHADRLHWRVAKR